MRIPEESKRWVELGFIDESQRGHILSLYQKKRSINPIYVLFAVLGSLLLGLGIILIFANNWENMPRNIKLCVSFLPLAAAMSLFWLTLLKRRESIAFREGTALGLCLSIFATLALISQVFHIHSDIGTYLRLCIFLSLPAIYFLEAKSPAAIYVACAIWSGAGSQTPYWVMLLSVAALAPFLVVQLKKREHKAVIWYLSVLSGAFITLTVFKLDGYWMALSIKFLSCAIFLLALDALIKRGKTNAALPLAPLSYLTIVAVMFISSFRDIELFDLFDDPLGLIVLGCAVAAYAAVRFYKQPFEKKSSDAFVLCALLGFPLFWLWSNTLLSILGIVFIVDGVGKFNLRLVNGGMFLLILVIAARFFDSELGLMERGIAFVVIGAGFILTNLLLHKKWRAR